MSTSRHITIICIAAILASLALTFLFMNGASLGIVSTSRSMGYEDRLFDTSSVHTIDIVMDDWDGFIETCENEEYSPCTVVIDGESYKNVGIRGKGNTSLSSVSAMGSQRYSFKLEFDQYETGKNYHGLDKLNLDNLIQDNTMMKDYLVYQLMGDFGVDAPLCSYVYITVNGEDWGLYLAVEGVEDSFLQRNYGSESGELYKPDSISFGGGRGNGMGFNFDDLDLGNMDTLDVPQNSSDSGDDSAAADQAAGAAQPQMPDGVTFPEGEFPTPPDGNTPQGEGMPQGLEGIGGGFAGDFSGGFGGMGSDDVKLKYIDDDAGSYSNIFDNAKTEITDADERRLIASLKNLSEYTELESTLDTDEVLRYFVVHNFVCNDDSYTGMMIHNYYLYEQDGQLSMIPWDYNLAFGTFQGGDASSSVNASIDNPISGGSVDDRPMLGWIFSDESYTQEYHGLFSEFIDRWFSDGQLAQMIEDTQELLQPYVEKDPTRFCTVEEFDTGVQTLERFVALRAEAVSRQLSGDASPVDTAGLNTSDMGSMDGTMGGGFGGGDAPQFGNDGTASADSGESGNGNFTEFPNMQPEGMSPGGSTGIGVAEGGSTVPSLILLGVSVLVLLVGLLVAVKVKH